MRLIGPASMGVISTGPTSTMLASFAQATCGGQGGDVAPGPALGIGLLELADRLQLGISSFVSLNSRADVSANDFLNYWDDDLRHRRGAPLTESFGNPRKFGRIARRVSPQPIVAVKSAGTADDVAADALYLQAGDPGRQRASCSTSAGCSTASRCPPGAGRRWWPTPTAAILASARSRRRPGTGRARPGHVRRHHRPRPARGDRRQRRRPDLPRRA
jgi:hypothetical protein